MPNYDFQCSACGLAFKKSLPFGSKEVPSCPKCKARSQKIIRPPMTIFKGSGFYKTDSAKPSETKAPAPSTEAPKPTEVPKPANTNTQSPPATHAQ